MSDKKKEVSKMLAEGIVQAIKKMTDDNNKLYVDNQIKNIGSMPLGGGSSLGGINSGNFAQAIIDAIGMDNYENTVSAAIVNAIIGNFDSLIVGTGVAQELYATYANFINLVATNGNFEHLDVANVWADIATIALARIDYLDVNHLIIRDSNGNRVLVTIDENGNIKTEKIDEKDENIPQISGGFISGDAIGDGTIGGEKLRVGAIETGHISADTFAELVMQKGDSIIRLIDDKISLIVKDTNGDGSYSNIVLTEEMIKLISDEIFLNAKDQFALTVNDIAEDVDAFSKLSATANKVYWLIADGNDASAFTLTPNAIELISKSIKLTADQLNIVLGDLDLSENESVQAMMHHIADSRPSVHRSETPPDDVNINDIWIQPSKGLIYQASHNQDCLPDFFIDDNGYLYYSYSEDQESYGLLLDEEGNIVIDESFPYNVSFDKNGGFIVWERVKDGELMQDIDDAAQAVINATNEQLQIRLGDVVTDEDGNVISIQSQITQNAESFSSRVSEIVNSETEGLRESYSELTQRADGIELELVKKVNGEELRTYVRYEDGAMELGSSASRYTTQISDNGFTVLQDGAIMTSIVQNTMSAPVIEANRQFQIGNFALRIGSKGHLMLV